jgi:hypothetical protein
LAVRTPGHSRVTGQARQDVAIADQLLRSGANLAGPAGWAELAGQAVALRIEAQRLIIALARVDRLLARTRPIQASRGVGDAGQQGPELSL